VVRNSGTPTPLFIARDAGGDAQPITSRPQVGRGRFGAGKVVLFGTGRFLEANDRVPALLDTQTFYGIFDNNAAASALPITRSTLLQQTIVSEQSVAGVSTRVTSTNVFDTAVPEKGWYMDFLPPAGFQGEMQVSDSVMRNGRIGFATVIPDPDPCKYGGRSWFMLLDAISGARVEGSSFDVDGNKVFNEADMATVAGAQVLVSGIGSSDGIMSQPRFVASPTGDLGLVTDTLNRTFAFLIHPGAGRIGRQSWRQLR
jgi:type IV pilus assembly protein PilY1